MEKNALDKNGKHRCFELMRPISIELAGGTEGELEDQDALKTGVTTFKEANFKNETVLSLVFPLDILDEEGTLFTMAILLYYTQIGITA